MKIADSIALLKLSYAGVTSFLALPWSLQGDVKATDSARQKRTRLLIGTPAECRSTVSTHYAEPEPAYFSDSSTVLIETTEDGLEVVRFPPSPLVYRKRVINVGAFYFTLEANGDPRAGLLLPSDGAPIVIEAGGSAVIMWDDEDERYRVNAPPEEV